MIARHWTRSVSARVVLLLSLVAITCVPAVAQTQDKPPSFTVAGRNGRSVALLVPKSTTPSQLRALVLSLREARRKNELANFFPPTTPRGQFGPYAIVIVYVMSEERWATWGALKECNEARGGSDLEQQCGRNVRAFYFYGKSLGSQPDNEEGSVGYAEGKKVFSRPYEKLF